MFSLGSCCLSKQTVRANMAAAAELKRHLPTTLISIKQHFHVICCDKITGKRVLSPQTMYSVGQL